MNTLKKTLMVVFTIFATFGFVACSSDDDGGKINNPFVGYWTCDDWNSWGVPTMLTFNNDGSFTMKYGVFGSEKGYYTYNYPQLCLSYTGEDSYTSIWTIVSFQSNYFVMMTESGNSFTWYRSTGETEVKQEISGTRQNHDYVDLGLSVKWATCNVGASRPEASGTKFAWGELATKEHFDWSNYKWNKDDSYGYALTKYCPDPDYGYCIYEGEYYDDVYFSDDLTTLTTADDVAYKTWGSQWRMPSKKQLEELVDRCSWKWTSQNGYLGFKVTGPNGKSIFMPTEHFFEKNGNVSYSSEVHYWSLSLNEESCNCAYVLEMAEYWDEPYVTVTDYDRCYGLFIRPVTQ
jgi:hypothetical protein